MKRISFIINPISGSGTQERELNDAVIGGFFPSDQFAIERLIIRGKGEATILVKEAVNRGSDIVVACGGDGTINEVARQLVHTEVKLGIIPRGSGNGLAGHLKIPSSLEKALEIIRQDSFIDIDTALAGELRFFSNCGIGFPAQLIRHYERIPQRKLLGYSMAGLASLNAIKDAQLLEITCNGRVFTSGHLFISNSNEMGYSMTLEPQASLQDGLLDVQIIPYDTIAGFTVFGLAALLRQLQTLKGVTRLQSDRLMVKAEFPLELQVDGEFHALQERELTITNQPASLKVLVSDKIDIQ